MNGWTARYLTYVVATHNRPQFLRRILAFWSTYQPQTRVLIADSSDHAHRQENKRICDQFQSTVLASVPLVYQYVDAPTLFKKLGQVAQSIETDFAVVCADDVLLIPETVNQCLRFLKSHPDFTCAQGMETRILSVPSNRCRLERGFNIVDESAGCRFRRMAQDGFSTTHAVVRTRTLNNNLRAALQCADLRGSSLLPELTHTHMTVLQGKVKAFPHHYLVHQAHDLSRRSAAPRADEALVSSEEYSRFRDVQVAQLGSFAYLDRSSAAQLIDRHYGYLQHGRTLEQGIGGISQLLRRMSRRLMRPMIDNAVLEPRVLKANNPICQDPTFQLAWRLIREFPDGMTEGEVVNETEHLANSIRRVA